MGDSGTKISLAKCKLNIPFQCISSTAGLVIASDCGFICAGVVLRGSSPNSSFDINGCTFNLTNESSLGISSSHGHKTTVGNCIFNNGMCGIMIDSEAICDAKNSTFEGCRFGCRSRDSTMKLTDCKMYECQKCIYSFGLKGNVLAKDSKFEKIALNCVECVSESSISLERCVVENSAICAVKATTNSNVSLADCKLVNCNTKVIVATGSSKIRIFSSNFESMSGNGCDFSNNSEGFFENVVFRRCSGFGILLTQSKLQMKTSQMSTVLSHCILGKQGSSLEASDCTFEFCNASAILMQSEDGTMMDCKKTTICANTVLNQCIV